MMMYSVNSSAHRTVAYLWSVCRTVLASILISQLSLPLGILRTRGFHSVDAVPSFSAVMSPRVVETQYGRLRGILVTVSGTSSSPIGSSGGPSSGAGGSQQQQQQQQQQQHGVVEAFLGLQYATLLYGDLRFMPPTSTIEKWDGVRVAQKFRPVCPQPTIPDETELRRRRIPLGRIEHLKRLAPYLEYQAEECLNLNIYVPVRDINDRLNNSSGGGATSSTTLLPVLVFVHGEDSYETGSGNAYDGSVLAWNGQIVVITINFRLGILGFLSTEDSGAPGNYALLDQVAALHWIKENIESFGGDPNEVTLMGQGRGAAMVNLLMISPISKGRSLFKRAILHSGSATTTWSVASNPLYYAKMAAEQLNCTRSSTSGHSDHVASTPSPGDSASAVVGNRYATPGAISVTPTHAPLTSGLEFLTCLKKLPVEALVAVDVRAPRYLTAFGPTIDGRSVLPEDVGRLTARTSESVFSSINLLIGVTRNEGIAYLRQTDVTDGIAADQWRRILRTYVQNTYEYHRQSIYDVISHQYIDWERSGGGSGPSVSAAAANRDPIVGRDTMLDLLGDSQTTAPVIETVRLHAGHSLPGVGTYMYEFNQPARTDVYPRWATGTPADELVYVFGAPLAGDYQVDPFPATGYSRADRQLSETVIRYWSNFVKTGNPNTASLNIDKESYGRSRSRSHDVTWPAFDSNKQEYLVIERKAMDRGEEGSRQFPVRHHYRGSKMALWLDLIPRLHRSDGLDARFHQLDDFTNRSSFDDNEYDFDGGTRQPDAAQLALLQSISLHTAPPALAPPRPSTIAVDGRRGSTTTSYGRPRRATVGPGYSQPIGGLLKERNVTPETPTHSQPTRAATGSDSAGGFTTVGLASLVVTIAVGSVLLALNAAIFAAVYVKRDRQRNNRRLVERQRRAVLAAAANSVPPAGSQGAAAVSGVDYERSRSSGNYGNYDADESDRLTFCDPQAAGDVGFDSAASMTLLDNGHRGGTIANRKSAEYSSAFTMLPSSSPASMFGMQQLDTSTSSMTSPPIAMAMTTAAMAVARYPAAQDACYYLATSSQRFPVSKNDVSSTGNSSSPSQSSMRIADRTVPQQLMQWSAGGSAVSAGVHSAPATSHLCSGLMTSSTDNTGAMVLTCVTSSNDGQLMTSSIVDVVDDVVANHVTKHMTATIV